MRPPYWELHKPLPVNGEIVLGRKFCSGCGRWRVISDFDQRHGKLRARCQRCRRIEHRDRYARLTEEQLRDKREYERMYHDAHNSAAGKPVRARQKSAQSRRVFLDVGPLLAMLDRVPVGELHRLAERAGTSERTILRLRHGPSKHVELDLADRLILALGSHLYSVYGDAPLVRVTPGGVRPVQ